VPLSPQAVAIIKQAQPDPSEPVIFHSRVHNRASIERQALSQAVIELTDKIGIAKFTPHDLRRTAATVARKHGVPRDHVKALLAHADDDTTAIYDQYDMLSEKRATVMKLATLIRDIVQ
jgi:integrase